MNKKQPTPFSKGGRFAKQIGGIFSCGYTLIELLLVIAIMAIIASSAILAYRHHIENSRLTKAALEIQNVMQAVISFNANTGEWPQVHNQIPSCTTTAPSSENPFVENYLPNQNALSNYGSYFCWGNPEGNTHLFWIAMQAPFNDINLAKRIAAQLPNAITTSNPNDLAVSECETGGACYIRAETPQTSVTAQTNGGIAGAGACPDSNGTKSGSGKNMSCTYEGLSNEKRHVHYQVQFDCPENTSAHLLFTPTFVDTGLGGRESPSSIWKLEPNINCTHNNSTPSETCAVDVLALRNNNRGILNGGSAGRGELKFSYVAFCSEQTT